MQTLQELAADVIYQVADLFEDDDAFEDFKSRPPLDQIRWRYRHSDCDDFAVVLAQITGLPIVVSSNPRLGPIHRRLQAPDGRLLDVHGWVTPEDLHHYYGVRKLKFAPWLTFDEPTDEQGVLAVLRILPTPPFTEPEFQAKLEAARRAAGL
jgi:hypothetical protein